jgi:hypothetical protein
MQPPYFYCDFETYSPLGIKKVGMAAMLNHPEAGTHCMSWSMSDDPDHVNLAKGSAEVQLVIKAALLKGAVLVAHNAPFELEVMRSVLGIEWPLDRVICTMARAAYFGYAWGLDKLAEQIGSPVLKDIGGKAEMLKLARGKISYAENPIAFERMYNYCKTDLRVLKHVHRLIPLLPPQMLTRWVVDQRINFQGMPIDMVAVENAIKLRDYFSEASNNHMASLTHGRATTVGQVAKIHEYVRELLPDHDIPDLSADTVEKLIHRLPEGHEARVILELRQGSALSSLAKFEKIKAYQVNGWLFHMATWYGAHTGRPTGGGPQMLNLPRSEYADFYAEMLRINPEFFLDMTDGPKRLKEALRGVILAPQRKDVYAFTRS